MKVSATHNVGLSASESGLRAVTIEDDVWDIDYWTFLHDYIRPLSLALGFHPQTVDKYLEES